MRYAMACSYQRLSRAMTPMDTYRNTAQGIHPVISPPKAAMVVRFATMRDKHTSLNKMHQKTFLHAA